MRILFRLVNGVLTYEGDPPKNNDQAIEISIAKWIAVKQFILDGASFNEGGLSSCGLCMLHYNGLTERDEDVCMTCPIYNITDLPLCEGTPYTEFWENRTAQNAQKEIDFLIGVKRSLERG